MPTYSPNNPNHPAGRPTKLGASEVNSVASRADEAIKAVRSQGREISRAARSPSSWWGQIITCSYTSGIVTVKPAYGTLPNLVVDYTADAVEAWQGDGWHIVGDYVRLNYNGVGVTPEWSVEQRIGGARKWSDPTTDGSTLASPQDNPGEVSDCG